LRNKIIIDSLNITIRKTPAHICDSANVFFNPAIISLAADELQQPLDYKWQFGTGRAEDTSNIRTPYFKFNNPGKYAVKLNITSPYGCIQETTDTVEVFKKAHGYITSPPEICQGTTAKFSASADINTNIGWSWTFNNGNTSNVQSPSSQQYNDSGTFKVTLVVEYSGCYDTVSNDLIVRARPNINLTPEATVCLGKSIELTASGGRVYSWRAEAGLNDYNIAKPTATPGKTTTYKVEVTNTFGCKNTDSTKVVVAAPFKVQIPGDAFICEGKNLQLEASGAATYQ
jgi:PKD repeat protein